MGLRSDQEEAARLLVTKVMSSRNFNSLRLEQAGFKSVDDVLRRWSEVPFTTKSDLVADAQSSPPWGTIATEPLQNYTRFCQTSGTSTGHPLAWLDTPTSWQVLLDCWRQVFQAAGIMPGSDRIFFAFSFGPFLGFWTAFEAAASDCLVIPSGGMSSEARLAAILRYGATVLCCTPTYALRLGEMLPPGTRHGIRKIIVAGETGGSVPHVRKKLEKIWGAAVFDHHGMTEVGPVTFQDPEHPGMLQVIHSAYHAEVLDPDTGAEVAEGAEGELVLTTLRRTACPLLRYRTGDWVRKRAIEGSLCLEGGILGRCDDMVVVRGVNVYPSAVDNIIRSFHEIAEYQVLCRNVDEMEELEVLIELAEDAATDTLTRLERRLKDVFSLRMPVTPVPAGTLPRHEFKAKRWIRSQG